MNQISVLFDGYWLDNGPPSGRNVLRAFIDGWSELFPLDHVSVAIPTQFCDPHLPDGVNLIRTRGNPPTHGAWTLSRLGSPARHYDAVLSQNFCPLLPFRPTFSPVRAVFFHDAMFIEHPEWFSRSERAYLRIAAESLRSADVILTSSAAECHRISRLMPHLGERVTHVGLGVPKGLVSAKPIPPANIVDHSKPFILTVGRLNVRKNLARLIEAFLAATTLDQHILMIVGARDGLAGTPLGQSGDRSRVRFLGAVPDSELRWLYQNCSFFVFPSLDEGFGLPLLEASHFEAPTAASDIPAFREMDLAIQYFDPWNTDSIRIALERMATTHTLRTHGPSQRDEAPRDDWNEVVSRSREAILKRIGEGGGDVQVPRNH